MEGQDPGKGGLMKFVRFIQWVAALGCLAMSAACFTSDGSGKLGGLMMLIAGWLISPMIGQLDIEVFDKLPAAAKAAVQIIGAAALFIGGYIISSQSAGNIPDGEPPAAVVSAVVYGGISE